MLSIVEPDGVPTERLAQQKIPDAAQGGHHHIDFEFRYRKLYDPQSSETVTHP